MFNESLHKSENSQASLRLQDPKSDGLNTQLDPEPVLATRDDSDREQEEELDEQEKELDEEVEGDDESDDGHPQCSSGEDCIGNAAAKLIRHVTSDGSEGRVYCEVCWDLFREKNPTLVGESDDEGA